MRNALLFATLLLLSLVCFTLFPQSPLSGAGYDLPAPNSVQPRFAATADAHLEPLAALAKELLAGN